MSPTRRDAARPPRWLSRHRTPWLALATLAATLGFGAELSAENFRWVGGSGRWTDPNNWSPRGVPLSTKDTATISTRNRLPFVIDVDSATGQGPITIGGLRLDDPNAILRPTSVNNAINVVNGVVDLLRGKLLPRRADQLQFGIRNGTMNVGPITDLTGPAHFISMGPENVFNAFDGELAPERTLVVRGNFGAIPIPGNLFVQNDRLTNRGTILLDPTVGPPSLFIDGGAGKLLNLGQVESGQIAGNAQMQIVASQTINHGLIDLADNATGQLRIRGDLLQRSAGQLILELAGPTINDFDDLEVTGTTILAGSMDIQFIDQFVPKIGQTLPLINSSAGILGDFDLVGDLGQFLGDGLGLNLDYMTAQQVILFVHSCGDADGDGGLFPDDLDLDEVLTNWNALLAAGALPDLNGDGIVGIGDLNQVLANFVAPSAPVPEPVGLMLLLAAAAWAGRRHR